MHHQFTFQQLYGIPTLFCIYPRTNSDLCHLQHKLTGFYIIIIIIIIIII